MSSCFFFSRMRIQGKMGRAAANAPACSSHAGGTSRRATIHKTASEESLLIVNVHNTQTSRLHITGSRARKGRRRSGLIIVPSVMEILVLRLVSIMVESHRVELLEWINNHLPRGGRQT